MAVAIGGSAALGAGASILGADKQAKGSKKAAQLQMQQFQLLNQQQQPFMRSGYGAMGKLNTLLGINPRSMPYENGTLNQIPSQSSGFMPTPGGGVQRIIAPQAQKGPRQTQFGIPANAPNINLQRILSLRAQNGDTEAQRVLEQM